MMKKGFKDIYTGLVLFAASLLMFFYVIPHHIKAYTVYGLPPSFFPKVITVALGVFSFILIISGLRQGGKEAFSLEAIKEHFRSIDGRPARNVLMIFGIAILYYIGLATIGFIISTPIIIFLLGIAFRWKRYVILILISGLTTTVLYLIFGVVLGSPLP